MSELIVCPDWAGTVAATGPSDEGPPRTCFRQPGYKHDPDDPAGTQVMAPSGKQKICVNCGKDLAGHRRFKDSRGYWCPACMEEDEKKGESQGTPCEKCGRKVPEKSLSSVDGVRMCVRCVREQRELRAPGNKKFRAVNVRSYKEHEKRKMLIMGIVLVVLLILMYVAWTKFPSL